MPSQRHAVAWTAIGGGLLVAALALLAFGDAFGYRNPLIGMPIGWLVAAGVAAGGVYLALPRLIRRSAPNAVLLAAMIGLGLVLRLVLLPSTPAIEDDIYRYLWDGAVVNAGINPYAHAPAAVLANTVGDDDGATLGRLAAESGEIIGRINHGELRTIYPPVAQAAFAVAHAISPWSLGAWRGVVLAFDLATLGLILALLAALRRSPLWAALYWWNPLVVRELFNAAHMDGLILPFLLGAVLLAMSKRPVWAAGALALAAGVKLWPALLLPVLLRSACRGPRQAATAVALFAGLCGLIAWPVLAAGLGADSGFTAYGRSWEMNDALFMAVAWAVDGALRLADPDALYGGLLARLAVAGALLVLIAGLCRRPAADGEALCGRVLAVTAAVFLLGPAQFPWYYVPLAALLAVAPRASLLLLSATLALYELRFYFDSRGMAEVFDHGIVWLEYVPVWLLLIREAVADAR